MADLAGVNGTREKFNVVGKPNLPGKLSYSLATGKAKFGVDYVFDNMLHAKFLRSPYANATGEERRCCRGKKDPRRRRCSYMGRRGSEKFRPSWRRDGIWWTRTLLCRNTPTWKMRKWGSSLLQKPKRLCDEALKALNPQWEVRPHVVDILEGRKPDAPVIRPNTAGGEDGRLFCGKRS